MAAALIVAGTNLLKMSWCALSIAHELNSTWQLLNTVLARRMYLRFALLIVGWLMLALGESQGTRASGAVALIAGEFLGRYLFFVSVVPTNMASGYLSQEAA